MQEPSKVAFLGLGAMGRRMASRLLEAGVDLSVWSRSGCTEPTSLRARTAPSVREAVAGAQVVFSMLRDDGASRAVWTGPEGALPALSAGAVAIECSTLSPAWITELGAAARRAGVDFLDAPVVGSRPQAEAGGLVFLASGRLEALERVRPLLALLGGAVHHLGASPAGTYAKLIVNTLFGVQVTAVAELLGLAPKANLDVSVLLEVLGGLPVLSASARAAAAGMVAGRFEPLFPVGLAGKDLAYAMAAAQALGAALPVAESAKRVFEAGMAGGFANENLTAVAKLYR